MNPCKENFYLKVFLTFSFLISLSSSQAGEIRAQAVMDSNASYKMPVISDPSLKVETVFSGLKFPSSMAFLGPNDILVLEKNEGTVRRILNGTIVATPLLQVNVSTQSERGLLGIAISKDVPKNVTYVFLFYTESSDTDTGRANQPVGNRLYRYELVNNKLINPKLLLDLPALPGPTHNGGKIVIGPDSNVYLTIGAVGPTATTKTQIQNVRDGNPPDGRGGILRITQDGKPVPNGAVLGENVPLSLYYAYGIRNSFGMDFDPISKKLWNSENGPNYGDEINLVDPGFNSGWNKVQGIWKRDGGNPGNITLIPTNLTEFGGKGKYSSPEFTWYNSTGPTSLRFLGSTKLGAGYQNNMFVGDFHYGNIYRFHLDGQRTSLSLEGPLKDRIANNNSELQGVIFGTGFGGITDLLVGPDGYLYVLALSQFKGGTNCDIVFGDPNKPCIQYNSAEPGTVFRVVPK
jgi:aldose sugar dehydrogenase